MLWPLSTLRISTSTHYNAHCTFQRVAHCTLQHTALHCAALQRTATHCNRQKQVANCNARWPFQRVARCALCITHCTLHMSNSTFHSRICAIVHIARVTRAFWVGAHINTPNRTVSYCNTLQCTAAYCNTLQRVTNIKTLTHIYKSNNPIHDHTHTCTYTHTHNMGGIW